MHGKVRLCVERCRHSWSCSVKRLRSSGAERARAPMSSAPAEPSGLDLGNVGRCGVFEQPGRAISSGLAEPSELERHFRAPQRNRAGSSGYFERPSGAELARAAISSALAEPSGLERPFRAPQRSRAGSSGHFERPSGAEWARAAISSAPAEPSGLDVANVGRCGVFEPGRVRPKLRSGPENPRTEGNFKNIYIY